jgi:hypothetical protein
MASGSVRTGVLATTIATFSVAALLGVVALLGSGFGETEARVLGTTCLVGGACLAVLCFLAVSATDYAPVGLLGGVVTLGTTVIGLVLLWAGDWPGDDLFRTFLVGIILAVALAQACLLLAVAATGTSTTVKVLLLLTLCVVALLAVLLCAAVFDASGDLIRLIGVLAILDVLGTVVVSALSRFGPAPAPDDRPVPVAIPVPLAHRLDAVRGPRTRDEVVVEAIEAWLRSAEPRKG